MLYVRIRDASGMTDDVLVCARENAIPKTARARLLYANMVIFEDVRLGPRPFR